MASTDTRSGFRLPWSSDRSHDESGPEAAADAATEPVTDEAQAEDPPVAAPTLNDALGLTRTSEQRPLKANLSPTAQPETEEPSAMIDMDPVAAPAAPAAPRKAPTKLMADMATAIRATAEAAQAQTLDQVASESSQVVESIRASSTDGATALKHQSEEDIAAIREWSKAEIARIMEETDARITSRKATLEDELAGHAAAVDRRVEEVRAEVARFEAAMLAYRERLDRESDPSRLATMAEELPDVPSFAAWADLGTLDITLIDDAADETAGDPAPSPAEMTATAEATAPTDWADAGHAPATPETEGSEAEGSEAPEWGDQTNAWAETADGSMGTAEDDGVPRWAAGDTPDGFPDGEATESGDPVDRGAIMAALEAAAEAVVAAEAAAESADQAEAAADVAETAAELLVGRTGGEDEYDPEAAAAMAARVDAGGYETETFTDRLASLLPSSDAGVGDETRTTQVVVSGLVSVASIASFKRHLGRLAGVQAVAVASGPEGEFVFNVTHRADLSFRDSLPTMPGFAARVTGTADGVVNVAARDPEAEG